MGTLNKPAPHDCMTKLQANPDMPYFLLLASDPSFGQVVRHWAQLAIVTGCHEKEKAMEALHCAEAGETWRAGRGLQRITQADWAHLWGAIEKFVDSVPDGPDWRRRMALALGSLR